MICISSSSEMRFNGMIMNLLYSKMYFPSSPFPNHLYPLKISLVYWTYRRILHRIYSRLRSLVSFEGGQPIRIYHTSFYDYLVSCVDERWHIDFDIQRRDFVNNCFDRMSELLRYNICELETSLAFNKDVPDFDECVKKNSASLLKCICCN